MNPYSQPPGYGFQRPSMSDRSYQQSMGYEPHQNYHHQEYSLPPHQQTDRNSGFVPPSSTYSRPIYRGRGMFGSPRGSGYAVGPPQGQQYGYQPFNGSGRGNQWHGRGGGFRKHEAGRGFPRRGDSEISIYFKPSMLEDPWKDLMAKLEEEKN